MRVAFTPIGGAGWTGGRHYLRNLLSALARAGSRVECLLFAGDDMERSELSELTPFLAAPPRVDAIWSRRGASSRFRRTAIAQRDRAAEAAFRAEGVDLVFQHSAWLGPRFGLPTVAWIADFQHRRLPRMFSPANWIRREVGYAGLSLSATTILLSSEDARASCERYYPLARGRTAVLPFAVAPPPASWSGDVDSCRTRLVLPARYLYLPNQFWKHKNHAAAVEALALVARHHEDLVLVMSGALADPRHPEHPRRVLASIERLGLTPRCRVLGVIAYEDVLALIRGAVAVLNPSFSEGWSTTVEEAKVFGTPLLLSDLEVHREQAPEARFFDPRSPEALAAALDAAWTAPQRPLRSLESVRCAALLRQERFAEGFDAIAREAVDRHRDRFRKSVAVPAGEVGNG